MVEVDCASATNSGPPHYGVITDMSPTSLGKLAALAARNSAEISTQTLTVNELLHLRGVG